MSSLLTGLPCIADKVSRLLTGLPCIADKPTLKYCLQELVLVFLSKCFMDGLVPTRYIHINIQEKVEGRGTEEGGGTRNGGKWVDWEGGEKKRGNSKRNGRERRGKREGGDIKRRGV